MFVVIEQLITTVCTTNIYLGIDDVCRNNATLNVNNIIQQAYKIAFPARI